MNPSKNNRLTAQSGNAVQKLLVITAVAIVILLGLGFWLAKKQGTFDNNLSLRFATISGEHLSSGMKVVYQGFPIGQVKSIELTSSGHIEGTLELKEKYRNLATTGSSLELASAKLVGAELVLRKHPTNTDTLKNNDSIELKNFNLALDLEKKVLDKIDPAIARVMAVVAEISDPHKGLPATLGNINRTLVSTEKLLNSLHARAQDPRVDHMLTNLDLGSASMVRNAELTEKTMLTARQVLGSTQKVMESTQKVMESTQKTMESSNSLIQKTEQTLQDFRQGGVGRWIAPARPASAASSSKN
ncbi:MAG: MCE family protein [Burkholderiales bacterium]|nr:MCE family protein [Burkholderiales bacterium]